MQDEGFDLTIALIVRTAGSLEIISRIMGTQPSRIFQKGDACAESMGNTWVLSVKYKGRTDIDTCLQDFIAQIPNCADKLSLLKQHGAAAIRISVVSLLGQMGFALCPEDIKLLNKLDIPLEVSIFSYGYCFAESDEGTV